MVLVLRGEEGLVCQVLEDGTRFERVSKFKYLRCVLGESGTDEFQCRTMVVRVRKVSGAIRPTV